MSQKDSKDIRPHLPNVSVQTQVYLNYSKKKHVSNTSQNDSTIVSAISQLVSTTNQNLFMEYKILHASKSSKLVSITSQRLPNSFKQFVVCPNTFQTEAHTVSTQVSINVSTSLKPI